MKRRGFLGVLFGAPAAAVVPKVANAVEEFAEKARSLDLPPAEVEESTEWVSEGEGAYYCDAVSTCVPLSRSGGDFIYRRRVK
jgi:hypothetical protein